MSDSLFMEEVTALSFMYNDSELCVTNDVVCLHLLDENLTLCFQIPVNYPNQRPIVSVKSDVFSKQQQKILTHQLISVIHDLPFAPVIISSVEKMKEFVAVWKESLKTNDAIATKMELKISFVRECLWFHHIYYRPKRRCIIEWAEEFHLHGICLFGKPGVVIIEGLDYVVKEYITRLRGLSWQKMSTKVRELQNFDSVDDASSWKKFSKFESLSNIDEPAQASNLSLLLAVLKKHNLSQLFKEVVGIT